MHLLIPKSTALPDIQQQFLENLKELQSQGFKSLLVITAIAAYLAAIRYFYFFRSEQAGLMIGLTAGVAAAILLRRRFPHFATAALLTGAWAAMLLETLAYPGGPGKYGFVLVIAAAGLALSEMPLIITGLCSAGFLALMALLPGSAASTFLPALLGCLVLTLLLTAANRLLLASLRQASHFVSLAEQSMDEARTDRGKLIQAVKALDEGNYRLQKAYQKIALAHDEANHARESKIQFANMISHEMRAPLNFIIGVTDFMVKSPGLYGKDNWPREMQEDITRIYQSSKHLSHLIDDVLTLGQIEANRVSLSFESSSIVDVIQNVLVIVRPSYEHRGLYLNLEADPDLPPLLLDRVRIRQVLLNLLNNAYRFIRSGGVTIRVQHSGSEVQVSVEDTGVGIPPEQIPTLFQDFVQVGAPNLSSSGGTGLGLSISRQFIELHGGHIWVESPYHNTRSGLGQVIGTCFHFTLPVRQTLPTRANEEFERISWNIQRQEARQNREVIVFSELSIEDLLPESIPNFQLTVLDDLEQIDHQIQAIQPYALVEISARDEPILGEKTRALLAHEAIPYLHCRVVQEDTGVVPLWDDYLVKPFSMSKVRAAIEEICPGAARFMVVDDDSNMLRFFELGFTTMGRPGTQVSFACSAGEARQMLQNELPEILFLDINLPDNNGLQFLEELKSDAYTKNMPVVIISAHSKPHLYNTRVLRIAYAPARMLQRERFIDELTSFLDALRVNAE